MTIAPVPVDEAVPGPRPDELDDAALLALYSEMTRVRAFEDEVIDAFGKGLIPGSTHPCIGAEGIKAGALSALLPDDLVFATYRGHGEALVKGVEPLAMMAELMGRATGVCKGKGGSMHLSEPSVGLISTNAIVAGHIPMAGGAALSCQFRKTEQVVLCLVQNEISVSEITPQQRDLEGFYLSLMRDNPGAASLDQPELSSDFLAPTA